MDALGYVKSHPYLVGGGIFVVGLAFILMRSGSGGGQAGGTDAALGQAYYGALAAQSHDAAAVQLATIQSQGSVATTQIQADAATAIQTKWADTSVQQTTLNNQAAIAMAPYATENELIATLGQIAQLPPTVTTKSSSGFFGIGGGSKQIVTPNPAATNASNILSSYINGLYAGH